MAVNSSSSPFRPVSPMTQEVRLATTMTGGVSLAVWMGGVAREINLLAQASDQRRVESNGADQPQLGHAATPATGRLLDFYLRLLRLLDVVVDVDILSGTSAGGINAALLGFARANSRDLGGLRELWLDLGSMLDLLRDPTDPALPSLMYGDRKLLADLANELPRLAPSPVSRGAARPSTTVYITTTLLAGENNLFTDSFGTLIHDVDHHGLFTFDQSTLTADKTGALALAARSTASFPGAFEPAFLPYDKGVAAGAGVPERPAMRDYAQITGTHWVADGGLLDNQPLDVVLQRVFDRPARRPVRRVLLYVVPNSGARPSPTPTPADSSAADPLGLLEALLKDLQAVTSQSITRDLSQVRAHNDRMTARVDSRLRLAELAARLPGRDILDSGLFADYCAREASRQTRPLVAALLRRVDASKAALPEDWRTALAIGGDNAEAICRQAIETRLRSEWQALLPSAHPVPGGADESGTSSQSGPTNLSQLTCLDRPAFDVAVSVALTLVRAAYQAARDEDRPVVIEALEAVHRSRPGKRADPSDIIAGADPTSQTNLIKAAEAVADAYRASNAVDEDAWRKLATATKRLARLPSIPVTASANGDPQSSSARRAASAHTLRTYRDYLDLSAEPAAVALQLFRLGAAQCAMLPADADQEQPVQLVQVSADTRSLLAPTRATAGRKLTGLQVHHFGAFYKRSWRANDWMWGRLDGAGWLVHVLLDPTRLQIISNDAERAGTSRVSWLISQLSEIAGSLPGSSADEPALTLGDGAVIDQAAIEKELAFLDDPEAPVPASIPLTALWVARAWQRAVIDDEIPGLADAIGVDKPGADWSPAASIAWARDVRSGKIAADSRLAACPVPDETLRTEAGSPLMIRTLAKAAATTAGALASVKQLPAAGKPILSTLRTVTLGGYRAVTAAGARPQRMIGIGALLLVVGTVAAVVQSSLLGLTGVAVAAIGTYLIAFGAWQKGGRLLAAITGVTITAALAALATTWVRQHLFGTSTTNPGWLGRNLHWVGDSWWRPWAVLAAILLAGALIAVVIPRAVRSARSSRSAGAAAKASLQQAQRRRTLAQNITSGRTRGS